MAFNEKVMVENKDVYFVKIKNNHSNFISIGGHMKTRDQKTLSITNVKVGHHKFVDLIERYNIHINFIFSPAHVKNLRFFEDVLRGPLSCRY